MEFGFDDLTEIHRNILIIISSELSTRITPRVAVNSTVKTFHQKSEVLIIYYGVIPIITRTITEYTDRVYITSKSNNSPKRLVKCLASTDITASRISAIIIIMQIISSDAKFGANNFNSYSWPNTYIIYINIHW